MSFAYELIKAGKYEWAGWLDITIKPPSGIYILLNLKEWGCAIGRLSQDEKVFICSLPHEDSQTFLQVSINQVTHWAIVPEVKKDE